MNLALFHLKIPKSTTQGPDLTGRADHSSQEWSSRGPYTFRKNVGQTRVKEMSVSERDIYAYKIHLAVERGPRGRDTALEVGTNT